jgi:signal peptidase I
MARNVRRTRLATAVTLLSTAALATVGARRSLLRVRGLSMRPTLREGDLVVTVPLPAVSTDGPLHGAAWEARRRLVRPGALVVLSEPGDRGHLIIKRVTAITPDGVDVVGDDPGWSIDSRTFGTVPHSDVRRLVLGRVPDATSLRAALPNLPGTRRSESAD